MITYQEMYLGLLNYVRDAAGDMPMFVRGTPTPSYEGKDEWFSFEILSFVESPSRRHTVDMLVDVQLICYTRHAVHRTDKDFTAMYKLMDKFAPLFHQKDVVIKNTCIQFKENRIVPLDLRSVGDYAKDILNQLPPLHTLSTVILNQGLISSSTLQ